MSTSDKEDGVKQQRDPANIVHEPGVSNATRMPAPGEHGFHIRFANTPAPTHFSSDR